MMIIVTDGGSRHGSLSAEKLISDFLDLLINEISLFLSIATIFSGNMRN